jgi:TPR repeat protein
MLYRCAVLVIALASCAPPPTRLPALTAAPSLAQARAYELGGDVPRDYARSAAIYAELCKDGHGDIAACHALADAIGFARGESYAVDRIRQLAATLCKRGDAWACLDEAWLRPPPAHDVSQAELDAVQAAMTRQAAHAQLACAHGDGASCLLLGRLLFGDEPAVVARRRWSYLGACRHGELAGCALAVHDLERCNVGNDLGEVAACEAQQVAAWRADATYADELDAVQRLQDGCTGGDAIACDGLPSRRSNPRELCAAHDYIACAMRGCLGDAAAAKQARDHGVNWVKCDTLRAR